MVRSLTFRYLDKAIGIASGMCSQPYDIRASVQHGSRQGPIGAAMLEAAARTVAREMAWDVAFRDGMSCSSQGKTWAAGTEREARAARDGASVLKRGSGWRG